MSLTNTFSDAVLGWFVHHGRHHLPWQENPNPYRVWVSEIMLQQTQVGTVMPYFHNFMREFPDVHALAAAPIDDVLHLWTGLGYYARARNLHRTAVIVSTKLGGTFPDTVERLCEMPGIGRSTAGAILSLGSGIRAPILDGNVKRVLCRYHAIAGWPDQPAVLRQLWEIAEQATPQKDFAAYTQAMMDLGATVGTRSKPACERCPLQTSCRAFALEATGEFPQRKPAKKTPIRSTCMLMLCTGQGEVLLEKRPDSGIWGGLWSLPEFADADDATDYCLSLFPQAEPQIEQWEEIRHTFSHFHLLITPLRIQLDSPDTVMEAGRLLWYPVQQRARVGLAAPVKKLLQRLQVITEST